MPSLGSVSSGGVSLQGEWREVGVLVECVCVISSLLGTLGLAAPSPVSVQDVERDVRLGESD